MATLKNPNQTKPKTNGTSTPATSPKVDPFADKFNAAAVGSGFTPLPIGKWEALVSAGGLQEKDGKELGWLEFTITEEGDHQEKKGRAFFTLFVDGEPHVGLEIFKRNLVDLSYLDPEVGINSRDSLEELLVEIKDDMRWVIINVASKKGYTNIFLDSVMPNQDDKPALDAIPM